MPVWTFTDGALRGKKYHGSAMPRDLQAKASPSGLHPSSALPRQHCHVSIHVGVHVHRELTIISNNNNNKRTD